MRLVKLRIGVVLSIVGMAGAIAQAAGSVLTAIPSDTLGFAVVHNLADVSRSVGELAKVVQAPAPDVLSLAKNFSGVQKGIDEQGDLAVVLTSIDPAPKVVVLIPVSNFADFFAALHVQEPATGAVEVQMAGGPKLVGRKGNYAAVAVTIDPDAFNAFLAANDNLAADAQLAAWIDTNKACFVLPTRGVKQLVPKLTAGIRNTQAQMRQLGGPTGQQTADALNMYATLLAAAEPEVDQFAVGLRIDSAQTLDLVKRVQFKPGGAWANWAANVKPATENVLAGMPGGAFVAAGGGVIPPGAMDQMMKFSVQMMQANPAFKMTPEQAQKFAQLSTASMGGVRAMRIFFGVPQPDAGLYGNMSAIMTVENAKPFLEQYEKTLAAMREFSQEVKSPMVPAANVAHTRLGDIDVLEITMDLPDMQQVMAPGAPDPQQMMKLFAGPDGKMKVYVAPADEHTVIIAYISLDNLKASLDAFKSKQPGIAADPGVAKVAAILPQGSQMVAYVSLNGASNAFRQLKATMPNAPPIAVPELSASPPLGIAAKVTPAGVEGHLVITADTLRTIGDAVAKFRQRTPPPPAPPR